MKSIQIIILAFLFVFFGFTSIDNIENNCFPLLWNNGITKRSWIYLNQEERKVYKKNSDITDGDFLNMPTFRWDAIFTDASSNQIFFTPNKTNPSFKFVTLGYKLSDQDKPVGFDFDILNKNKKSNEAYVFRIRNNSQKERSKIVGKLREVGIVFDNWPQYWPIDKVWTGGNHSFSNNYQIELFDKIVVKYQYRLISYNKPLKKELIKDKWLGSYATCDFRFNEYDLSGTLVNSYLLGVVFSNPLQVDFNDNNNDSILFGSTKMQDNGVNLNMLLLHGNKVGIKEVNTVDSTKQFHNVEIDFIPLLKKYFKINYKHVNIITGLDIYSATRAADFTFDIKDIQVLGCK